MTISQVLKIPPCKITYLHLPEEYSGVACMFMHDVYQINVNEDVFKKMADLEVTAGIIHEMRHAYQWFQVKNPNLSKEPPEIIQQWQTEFFEYVQPLNGDDLFMQQSLEIDAVAFTALITKLLFRQTLKLPESIKEKVYQRITQIEKEYEFLRKI